jgi:hypothetical protein
MRALTRDQLLTVMGMTSGGFDAQQRAGHVALAFGSPHPAMPGRYCDLDLVGLAIANGLAPTLGRPTATTVTLGFFDQWVAAVGQADADTSQNYFFAIGLFGWDENQKHPQEIVVTHGTSKQIMDDLRDAGYRRQHHRCYRAPAGLGTCSRHRSLSAFFLPTRSRTVLADCQRIRSRTRGTTCPAPAR